MPHGFNFFCVGRAEEDLKCEVFPEINKDIGHILNNAKVLKCGLFDLGKYWYQY